MNTQAVTRRRVSDGEYALSNGYKVLRVSAEPDLGIRQGWHLIDPTGEWCQTYDTLRDAVNGSDRIETICERHPI